MLFVCLSHFSTAYFPYVPSSDFSVRTALISMGMLASPTFVCISGSILGLLSETDQESFDQLRLKLVDRALFMLLIGHVLIALTFVPVVGLSASALADVQITDVIAVSVLIGVGVVRTTSRLFRLSLGLACLAVSWMLVFAWHPAGRFGEGVKELVVGATQLHVLSSSFPILPWVGVYLMGVSFGQRLSDLYRRGDHKAVERVLLLASLCVFATALMAHAVRGAFAPTGQDVSQWLYAPIFSPWTKQPPSPAYFAFFGGLGLGLMWLVMSAAHRGLGRQVLRHAATVGRCSLGVFLAQFFVYWSLIRSRHLPYSAAWPLLLLASLVVLFRFAQFWDRHRLNRLLTVGLRPASNTRSRLSLADAGGSR